MEHLVRCPNCGFLQKEANFCRECGGSLEFAPSGAPPAEPVPFPWGLFAAFALGVMVFSGVLGLVGVRPEVGLAAMVGLVLGSSVWVVLDATRRGVPRPWVWCLAVWLFWLVCFPWYLARRRHPERPCLLDSPRNAWEVATVIVTGAVLTFFVLALERFLGRFAGP